MIKKIIAIFCVSMFFTSIFGLFLLFYPYYATTLQFHDSHITIQRNDYNIPYIHSPDRRSYLYALGNVIAQDRLFQMSFRRLFGQGRISQYIGEKGIEADIMMREIGMVHIAKQTARKLKKQDPEGYKDLQAYAIGINEAVQRMPVFPFQFYLLGLKWEPWTVADIYLIYKIMDWGTSFSIVEQMLASSLLDKLSLSQVENILPGTKEGWAFDSVNVIKEEQLDDKYKNSKYKSSGKFSPLNLSKLKGLGIPDFISSVEGSNAWVISGKHTKSGKPIIGGDPHLDNGMPSQWYQVKATYKNNGKKVQFAGVCIPGMPLAYGQTPYLAIALTTIYADTQDLYREKVKGEHYWVDNIWRNLGFREEVIKLKTPEGFKEIKHKVRLTHRGPIISYVVSGLGSFDLTKDTISLAWAGFNEDHQSLLATIRHIEITKFSQAKTFLKDLVKSSPSISMLAATADNHICYQQLGNNPIRNSYKQGRFIKDGTTSEHDWKGMMPPEDRLSVCDHERGYFVVSNNQAAPDSFYGGYLRHSIFTARADRLEELIQKKIASGDKIQGSFAEKLLYDTVDVYCRRILPEIREVVPEADKHLQKFDCSFVSDSQKPALYEIFMYELWLEARPKYDLNFSVFSMHNTQQFIFNYIHKAFNGDEKKKTVMKRAWKNMEQTLSKHFSTDDKSQWKWGLFHRDVMKHLPLGLHPNIGWIFNKETEGWGNLHTPNVGKCNKAELGSWATSHRANYRHIFDFGGQSSWIVDSGSSQTRISPHYDDQWEMFMKKELIPVYDKPKIDGKQKTSQL